MIVEATAGELSALGVFKKKKKGKKVTRHNRYILVQSETHYYLSNGLFFYLNLKPKYCFDIQKALGGHLEMFIFAGIHLI